MLLRKKPCAHKHARDEGRRRRDRETHDCVCVELQIPALHMNLGLSVSLRSAAPSGGRFPFMLRHVRAGRLDLKII